MRVLLLSWEHPPVIVGGLGRHTAALSRHLAAQGHEVHVLTRGNGDAPADEWVQDVHIVRVSEPPPRIPFDTDHLLAWVMALDIGLQSAGARLLREHDIDVIHAHDWLVAYAAAGLKASHDLPLVATIHATEYGRHQGHLPSELSKVIHQVEWWLTYEARRVITCSRYMKRQVATLFELPAQKIDVVPNGVAVEDFRLPDDEVAAFRREALRRGERMVVFAGRLEWEKGVQTVLHAMERILDEVGPVRFFVAGEGSYLAELRKLVRTLKLTRRVEFTGFLEDHELRLHYGAADVAVTPSIYEPFGLVAIEAMACGTPVVVGDTGGLREIARGGAGLRFEPEDPEGLADALIDVLTDAQLSRRLVDRAADVIARRYDWAAVARRTSEVYSQAVTEEQELRGDPDPRPPLRALLERARILQDDIAG